MSKESQTPRSRREARLQRGPGGNPDAGGTPAGVAGSMTPPSVPSEGTERSSQARARDREAHRAYRALTEAIPVVPAAQAQPTRRQLRRQQLEREQGPQTEGSSRPPVAAPTNRPVKPVSAAAGEAPAKDRPLQAPQTDAQYRSNRPPIEGGRRERRRRSTATATGLAESPTTDEAALPDAAAEAVDAGKMTVEQALVAKELLMGQAKNLAAMMEARKDQDPRTVDLEILAQQKALAERAAVLNRRAADKQRLSQENQQRRQTAGPGDIASAPMEFVRLPGSDKHVLRPSPTSNVPLVSNAPERAVEAGTAVPVQPAADAQPQTPKGSQVPQRKAAPAEKPTPVDNSAPTDRLASIEKAVRNTSPVSEVSDKSRPAPAVPGPKPATRGPGPVTPGTRPSTSSAPARSRLLAQAEAVADGRGRKVEPLSARSAHGLDPLDARTAGQANSARVAVIAALVLGGAAFIIGLIMMIVGLSN
ncbi:hypothetical protein [Crystallibacter degradans]|uniref:hypothetical protein n=1 Tax=Crystallibacter degradans TaxID=2726743 RepID=UPI0014727578|nr:hypothetical protein [Arthrobacter sp. SF27]NMR31226.1 hypothetical protein [Arthrobacter sp. SF27]